MDKERTSVITIGDEEYTLLLTTKATKEIAGRYGGLENLGEQFLVLEVMAEDAAITEALYKGTKRNVESEKESKNAQVG